MSGSIPIPNHLEISADPFTWWITHPPSAMSVGCRSFPTFTKSIGQGTYVRILLVTKFIYSSKESQMNQNKNINLECIYGQTGLTLKWTWKPTLH